MIPLQAVDQRRESLTQGCKQLLKSVKAQIGFKGLSQRFPAGARLRQLTRLLAAQIDQGLQRSAEQTEVGPPAGQLPTGITIRLGCGQGGHQSRVQGLLPSQILLKQIEIATMPVASIGIG